MHIVYQAGLEPRTSRADLRQACYSHVLASPWTGSASGVRSLDAHCLASFAAASSVCLAAAQGELRAALHAAVTRCLGPGSGPETMARNALVSCPYFSLPEDLLDVPER
jgi:hypothetical protein